MADLRDRLLDRLYPDVEARDPVPRFVLGLTPNRWHDVASIATMTPTAFHKWVNARRGRPPEDTFPTVYRLNTRHDQARWFGPPHFRTAHFERIEVAPNYLSFSAPTLLAGAAWERTVNSTALLERFRVCILSAYERLGG